MDQLITKKIQWCCAIIIPALVMFIPSSQFFTIAIKLFFGVTIFVILMMAFDLVPMIISAILLPIMYVVLKLAPPVVVFQPWTTQIPSLLVGAFIITAVMDKTGLSKRIAYWCLLKTGGSYSGMLIGTLVAGLVLSLVMPGGVGRAVLLGAIMLGICKALNLAAGSKRATGLFLATYVASGEIGNFIFTSTSPNLFIAGMLQPYGVDIGFLDWAWYTGVPTLIWGSLCTLLIFVMFRDTGRLQTTEYLREQLLQMGKISTQEKKLLIIVMVAIVLFMTNGLHKIPSGYILAIAGLLCFWPKIGLADQAVIKEMNFVMIFLTVGMVSIGNVSMNVGAGDFIANSLLPIMPENITLASMIIYLAVFIGNLLLTPLALMSGLLTPLIDLGLKLGMHPAGTAFIFGSCATNIILPHEIVNALIIFGFGMITMKDFVKYFALRSLLFIPALAIIYIPWFKLVGIL